MLSTGLGCHGYAAGLPVIRCPEDTGKPRLRRGLPMRCGGCYAWRVSTWPVRRGM